MKHSNTFASPVRKNAGGGFLSRLRRSTLGNTTIETAMILPVLLAMLMGIIEFGRAFWVQTSLQYAVNDAARCASLGSTTCTNIPTYAASKVYGMSIPATAFTYTASANCGNTGYAAGYQVTASYNFKTVVARLIPQLGTFSLTASACHP